MPRQAETVPVAMLSAGWPQCVGDVAVILAEGVCHKDYTSREVWKTVDRLPLALWEELWLKLEWIRKGDNSSVSM